MCHQNFFIIFINYDEHGFRRCCKCRFIIYVYYDDRRAFLQTMICTLCLETGRCIKKKYYDSDRSDTATTGSNPQGGPLKLARRTRADVRFQLSQESGGCVSRHVRLAISTVRMCARVTRCGMRVCALSLTFGRRSLTKRNPSRFSDSVSIGKSIVHRN